MCYELNAFAQMIYKEQSPKKVEPLDRIRTGADG